MAKCRRKIVFNPANDSVITITYTYDPLGNRLEKVWAKTKYCSPPPCYVLPGQSLSRYDTTKYIRDAQGNILAVYHRKNDSVHLIEWDIYGSKRIGVVDTNLVVYEPPPPVCPLCPIVSNTMDSATTAYLEGQKQYELDNHLGNVMVTVSDKVTPVDTTMTPNIANYYEAVILSAQDYYPFGMVMPGRSYTILGDSSYRFGYNTQIKDNDIYGEDNAYGAQNWEYSPREVHRWNLDPKPTGTGSQYVVNKDNPILNSDPNGDGPDDPPKTQGSLKASLTYTFGYKKGTSGFNLGVGAGGSVKNNSSQVGINASLNVYNSGLGMSGGQTGAMRSDVVLSESFTFGGGKSQTAAPLNTFNASSLTGVTNDFKGSGTFAADLVFGSGGRNQIEGSMGFKAGDVSLQIYDDTKRMGGGGTDQWWTGGGNATISNFGGNKNNTLTFGNDVFTGVKPGVLDPLNTAQTFVRLNTANSILQISHSGQGDMYSQNLIHNILGYTHFPSAVSNQLNFTGGLSLTK